MIISILKLLVASIVFISILYYFFSLYCIMRFFRQKPGGGNYLPPVTVLKPLNGLEDGIFENLLSHLNQDYPSYQIIFGVNNDSDPVISVVERLRKEFPEKDVEFVISGKAIGPNLKVSNLNNMYDKAKHDVIVINDSDTKVGPDYLRRVVSELKDPSVGGTTCVYKVRNSPGLASAIGTFFVNDNFIPSALVAHTLGMNFGYGATIVIKKKVLEEIGGFPSLADYIAEDYQIGQRVIDAGYRLHVSNYVVLTALQKYNFWDQIIHLLRWVSTIRVCRPKGYFFRIFTMGTPFSILFLIISNFSSFSVALFFSHLFARYFTTLIINIKYFKEKRGLGYFFLLPLLDLAIFVIWCWGLFVHEVAWRGNTFRLREGGMVTRE
ncbi:MAG: bacteriohopanetetrol glucosamine biosynthesis glycosyltransferase HpnI [Candidatus Brocadiales bacterium]